MDMTVILHVLVGLLLGGVLGLAFFGGLWYTVRNLPRARHPAVLALASFMVRLALAVGGFYLVLRLTAIAGVVSAVIGFVGARFALTRVLASAHSSEGGSP